MNNNEVLSVVIPAAGLSRRMKTKNNKPYLILEETPVLSYSLAVFDSLPEVGEIVVVVKRGEEALAERAGEIARIRRSLKIVVGGMTRGESVFNGLKATCPNYPFIAVHDAARPCITPNLVRRVMEAAFKSGAATAASRMRDTCAASLSEGEQAPIISYVPRSTLIAIQTPQIFRRDIILTAHERAAERGEQATDDTTLVKAEGHEVTAVMGPSTNIKLTEPEDLPLVRAIIKQLNISV
ncbi:MAG: 2-C-methyl-D-erythritol 4-phosphate cytidylyltransferase [Eubacteriaceae bacterium]|nr:2-C-methyl-D-erythritol 4-phosphate cytidylyltransferase [Eubacteriaceae bacterium]